MFCNKCGAENPAESNFCAKCGNDLKRVQKFIEEHEVSPSEKSDHVSSDKIIIEKKKAEEISQDALSDPEQGSEPDISVIPEDDESVKGNETAALTEATITAGGDHPPRKPKKSKKGWFFLFILGVLSWLAYEMYDKDIPMEVTFFGNTGGYTVQSLTGEIITAGTNGNVVFRDTIHGWEPGQITFKINKSGYKKIADVTFKWSGRDMNPLRFTKELSFRSAESKLNLTFNLAQPVEDARIVIDGKVHLFNGETVLRIPSIIIRQAQNLEISAETPALKNKILLPFHQSLSVKPGGGTIHKKYKIIPRYAGEKTIKFMVKDETGKSVAGALVDLGYGGLKKKTNQDGKVMMSIKQPEVGSSFLPNISKGQMAPIKDIGEQFFSYDQNTYDFSAILKVQDMVVFTIKDLNGRPLTGVKMVASDGRKKSSNNEGMLSYTSKSRGKTINHVFTKIGYQSAEKSVMIKQGETRVSEVVVMQSLNVSLAVVDQFTNKPIPNVNVRIIELKKNSQTTDDPLLPLFGVEMGKTYNLKLSELDGKYVSKKIKITVKGPGQVFQIPMEPKPRIINLTFLDGKGKALEGVQVTLHAHDGRLMKDQTAKKGRLRYRVYRDTTYLLEYEYGILADSRRLMTDGEWEISQDIVITSSCKLEIIAEPGSPEIRVIDSNSDYEFATGVGELQADLQFGTYRVECDCEGGLFQEVITLNKTEDRLKINCTHPWVLGRGFENLEQWTLAKSEFERIDIGDQYYCAAQERLFLLYQQENRLDNKGLAKNYAQEMLVQRCSETNNPYLALNMTNVLLQQGDFDAAQKALDLCFTSQDKFLDDDRVSKLEELEYLDRLIIHQEALAPDADIDIDERCQRLNSLIERWANVSKIISNPGLLENIDVHLGEIEIAISTYGCD